MQCQEITNHSFPKRSYHSMIVLPDNSILCIFGSLVDDAENGVYILPTNSNKWECLNIQPRSKKDGIPSIRYAHSTILRTYTKTEYNRPAAIEYKQLELSDAKSVKIGSDEYIYQQSGRNDSNYERKNHSGIIKSSSSDASCTTEDSKVSENFEDVKDSEEKSDISFLLNLHDEQFHYINPNDISGNGKASKLVDNETSTYDTLQNETESKINNGTMEKYSRFRLSQDENKIIHYEVIVFGGTTHGKVLNDIWKLTWDADQGIQKSAEWVKEMSHDPFLFLSGHRAVYDEESDAMIVFGGKNQNKFVTNSIYSYSFRYRLWKQVNELNIASPSPRQNHAMVKWNHNFFVFGGNNLSSGKVYKDLWKFNLKTREWSQYIARNNHCVQPPDSSCPAMEVVDNRLYVYPGGSHRLLGDSNNIDCIFLYDIECNSWLTQELKGVLPPPRSGHTLTKRFDQRSLDKQISTTKFSTLYPTFVICGGVFEQGELNDMYEIYDAEFVVQKQGVLLELLHQREVVQEHNLESLQNQLQDQSQLLDSIIQENEDLYHKKGIYQAHIEELETQVKSQTECVREQELRIKFLENARSENEQNIYELEHSLENSQRENETLRQQLTEALTSIDTLKKIREDNITFITIQEKEAKRQQLDSERENTLLKEQNQELKSVHAALLNVLENKREEVECIRDSMKELISNHRDAIESMKQNYTLELQKIQSLIASYKKENLEKEKELKSVIGQLQLQEEIDDFIFSESWRIPENEFEIVSDHTGKLKGIAVEIHCIPLGKKSLKMERMIASQVFTQTRVRNRYVQSTYGVVLLRNNSKAVIVREKMEVNLKKYLQEKKPMIQEKVAIIHQLAFALKTLHKKQITLRALHPGAIQFSFDRGKAIPKLCLHLCDGDTVAENFLAPEIYSSQSAIDSYKLDIFAFGMLIYYIVSETEPQWKVAGGEFGALAHSLPSFNSLQFETDEGKHLQKIIQKCHEFQPSDRPNIDEILGDISNI